MFATSVWALGRRHLVNAYEVKAGIGVVAGNTVLSMSERLRGFMTRRCINPLYLTLHYLTIEATSTGGLFCLVAYQNLCSVDTDTLGDLIK